MPQFDPRSFLIISAALGLLFGSLFFVLRRSFPRDIGGLTSWAWGCLIEALAVFLYDPNGTLPVFWSSFVDRALIVGGIILFYSSLRLLAGNTVPVWHLACVLAVSTAALAWYTFVDNDYHLRVTLVSAVCAGLLFASAVTILRMPHQGFAERFSFIVTGVSASLFFLRTIAALLPIGVLVMESDTSTVQQASSATFAVSQVALSLGFMLMVNSRLHRQIEHTAAHDPLTGLWRREAMAETIHREMPRAVRHGHPLAILMVDLDNFKAINDEYGHLVGDRVITDFASTALQVLRSHDVMGRFGGEEFIVMLPETSMEDAIAVAERLRLCCVHQSQNALPSYTVSIGIAALQGAEEKPCALVHKADQALYEAKRGGKNRVEVHA